MLYNVIILAAAKAVGVPGALLLAICLNESNLNNLAVMRDGGSPSYGICQLKKSTAVELGYEGIASGPLRKTTNPAFLGAMEPIGKPKGLMIVSINARYAALYLKKQLDRYDGDWCHAVAAYNSGTYLPSSRSPGKPKNYKYIKQVTLRLDEKYKDYLVCGPREVEVEEE